MQNQTTSTPSGTPASQSLARPIALHVAGGGLLLEGRFDHWLPIAVISDGDPTATAAAQILLDSTSPANVNVGGEGGRAPGADLFTFDAHEVKAVGPHSYSAKGTLQVGDQEAEAELVIQTPEGHSPFFFVTVPIDRSRFDDLWTQLEERAVQPLAAQQEMRPQAWLRVPVLAAA